MGWQIVARVYLDSGTRRISDQPVRSPSEYFEGRVLDWGFIDRSIAIPVGLPRTSDAKIRIADTDKSYRIPLQTETARRRKAELIRFQEGAALSTGKVIFTGEVRHVRRGPGYIEMTIQDRSFAWLDEPTFPNLINRTRFPELSEDLDEAFFPVIFGEVLSPASNPQGVIPLPRINETRWAVCVTFIEEVTAVYRKVVGADTFSLVSSSEYSLTTVSEFFENAFYDFQFLDFNSAQDPSTQIRIDAKGIMFSHLFQEDLGTARRNPVDHIYTMLKVILLRKMPPGSPGIDDVARKDSIIESTMLDRESALETYHALETASPSSGGASDTTAYLSDGAMVSSMTFRAWLGRILTSSNIDLFTRRDGKIAMTWNYEGTPDDPEINDTFAILRETFFQDDASPTKNRIRYHYMPNLATQEFAEVEAYDNLGDQDTLGTPAVDSSGAALADSAGLELRDPFIEEEEVNFWYVRDALTALDVASIRASVQALGAFRFQWRSPGPEFIDALDLTEFVRLVHVIESLGATPAKIYQLTEKLGPQVVDVKAIALPALPIEIPEEEEEEVLGIGTIEVSLEMVDGGLSSSASSTVTFTRSSMYFDTADYEDAGGVTPPVYFRVIASNESSTDAEIRLIDVTNGNAVVSTITIPGNSNSANRYWFEDPVALTLAEGRVQYRVRLAQTSTGGTLVCYGARMDVAHEDAVKTRLQFVFGTDGAEDRNSNQINTGWDVQFDSTTYAQNQPENHYIWPYEASFYQTPIEGESWSFETVARETGSGNDACLVALFNRTTDQYILHNTHVIDGGAASFPIIKSQDFDPSIEHFTDGENMEVRVRSNVSGHSSELYRACLYVRLENLTRTVVWKRIARQNSADETSGSFQQARQFIGLNDNVASVWLDATGRQKTTGGSNAVHAGRSSSHFGGGTTVPGSISFTSTSRARYRSADIRSNLNAENEFLMARVNIGAPDTIEWSQVFLLYDVTL